MRAETNGKPVSGLATPNRYLIFVVTKIAKVSVNTEFHSDW
ncbi:MAG: hypothetical protein V8Q80_05875 [Barnesiella intestinihominis]